MIIVTARVTLKSGEHETFLSAVAQITPSSRAEPGCISYHCYADPFSKHDFLFVEEWDSQDALNAHFETAHFIAFSKIMAECTVGSPIVKMYQVNDISQR